ncbi:putative major sperm protein (MSP) [Septoria linicola]|nr:putative major sperm protein (MSP) [Septoria linicola]
MSVELTPPELGFRRPFTHEVSQVLRLHNPNSEPVAFKVKTTAPKQYCVRPNSGRIDPGGDVEVQVLLQAMKEDPPLDARCRDKFLVQSVAIDADVQVHNVTQVWANIEQTAKSSIQEKKIRVSFLPADGSAGLGAAASPSPATNGLLHHEDEPPAYSSPSPAAVTPARNTASSGSGYDKSPVPAGDLNQSQSTLHSATAAVSNATGVSQAELERQLAAANKTISDLRAKAAEATGLRQRNVGGETATTTKGGPSAVTQAAPGGVPVQIVAAIALLSFLIAYLFF